MKINLEPCKTNLTKLNYKNPAETMNNQLAASPNSRNLKVVQGSTATEFHGEKCHPVRGYLRRSARVGGSPPMGPPNYGKEIAALRAEQRSMNEHYDGEVKKLLAKAEGKSPKVEKKTPSEQVIHPEEDEVAYLNSLADQGPGPSTPDRGLRSTKRKLDSGSSPSASASADAYSAFAGSTSSYKGKAEDSPASTGTPGHPHCLSPPGHLAKRAGNKQPLVVD